MWPRKVEWQSDQELVVEMGYKTDSSKRWSDHRAWRSVEVEIVYR